MFRLFRAIFSLSLGGYICIYCSAVKDKLDYTVLYYLINKHLLKRVIIKSHGDKTYICCPNYIFSPKFFDFYIIA